MSLLSKKAINMLCSIPKVTVGRCKLCVTIIMLKKFTSNLLILFKILLLNTIVTYYITNSNL